MKFARSFISRVRGSSAGGTVSTPAPEVNDIAQLQAISAFALTLKELKPDNQQLLVNVANTIKTTVEKTNDKDRNKIVKPEVFEMIQKTINRNNIQNKKFVEQIAIVDVKHPPEVVLHAQSWLRTQLLQLYLIKLQSLMQEGEVTEALTYDKLLKITDAFLLGSSSERLAEHTKLFGESLSQYQLQTCFYGILEPELHCCQSVFTLLLPVLDKHHKKTFPKYNKDYLLDRLELNVKSRCVFSWADPTFSGFKPLPDEHMMPVGDLLKARHQFFKEGASLGNHYLNEYIGETRKWYIEKQENRTTIRNGILFFIGTCFADWYVCIM